MSAKRSVVSQDDLKLEFVLQIYKQCREQHGDDDEQTRLILKYISVLERQLQAYQGNRRHVACVRLTA